LKLENTHVKVRGEVGTKLDGFFEPKSIAIIGASNDPSKISGRTLRYLLKHGFPGSIFPINPTHSEIAGIKCYASLAAVPKAIDLAIITRAKEHILDSLNACSEKGVHSVVIFSSGFAETGKEGEEIQETIKGFVRKNNIRVLGPNCLGFVNIHKRVTASFGGSLERDYLIPGNVGFLSQSGAFSNLTFAVAQDQGIGFSYWISTGNEMDLGFSDCLEYLINDHKTKLIAIFIEGLRDGKKFLQVADKAIETGKPLVALKVGTSKAGTKASLSHTGAMTGSDDAYDAVFNQKRIIRTHSIEELIDYIFVLLNSPFPRGRNVGIITITGGGAILMADRLEECGLRIPPLEGLTKDRMLKVVPPFGSAVNPVDLTGQLIEGVGSISESIDILMAEDGIDVIVVLIGMLKNFKDDLIRDFAKAARMGRKPLAIVWMDPPPGAIVSLKDKGIPVFEDPTRCANAVGMLVKYAESIRR
jgi:acetyltransferase